MKELFRSKMPDPSDQRIDIIMPVVEKDLDTLPLSLEGIRRNVLNPIGRIYLIGPENRRIAKFAKENDCVFIDEQDVLGFGPKDLNVVTHSGVDRSGWLFQQFLKLSGEIGTEKWFVTMDADHVLLRPHTFIDSERRHVFYQSYECNLPYYRTLRRILGDMPLSGLSFVAHKMVFNKDKLKRMRETIERHGYDRMKWWQVILNALDMSDISPFSEFETYGNFIENEDKVCLPWRSKNIRNWTEVPNYDDLKGKYGRKYLSATLSAYNRCVMKNNE